MSTLESPDPPSRFAPAASDSSSHATLARRVLRQMALRLSLVTIALTGASYYHVKRTITGQSINGLASYVQARGERERSLFRLSEDNHVALRTAFLDQLRTRGPSYTAEEFDRRYVKFPDGAIRSRPEGFDGTQQIAVFIDDGVPMSADVRRLVLSAHDVIERFGPPMKIRFLDTWLITPESIGVVYWPSQPKWTFDTKTNVHFSTEEAITVVDPQHNPERKTAWTKNYPDPTTKECMVSVSTPVYDGDRFIGAIGHDMLLTDLVRRTESDAIEGTYNVLLRKDGFVIAHPRMAKAIADAGGSFDVTKAGDPELQAIFRRVTPIAAENAVVESEDGKSYLGVARITGPDWYLVSVYPKALLEKTAYQTARFILFGGLIALVLELALVYAIFRNQVQRPLAALMQATKRLTSGEMAVALDTNRPDELGRLALSFNTMASAVRDREQLQKSVIAERERAEQEIRNLNEELAKNLEGEREKNQVLESLRLAVDALSAPVLEVWANVLAVPVIGAVDEQRSAAMTEKLLDEVSRTQCRFVILDVTGVEDMDTVTAHRLLKVVSAVELLGARCLLTGIRPPVARALVALGADFGSLTPLRTLKNALEECLRQMGNPHGGAARGQGRA